ncbi:MAG TPA: transglycosylase domain-containing protein, partial [Burkholderiaceae bacterium]|nr:transglycosylase domain-containing protein [Burkholderiaceae bacterium]
MRAATIAAEDRRFASHGGVDWAAVAGAAVGRAQAGGTRGASTITMQLVGLVDADLALPRGGRSIVAKIGQAAAALQLERHWTKAQILEAYLNLVPFRGELVGVDAMSHGLFEKMPSGLDADESAIAAALLRAPNAAPALVGRRACEVLEAQGRAEDCVAARGVAESVLGRPPAAAFDAGMQLAPHFARQVMAGFGPGASGLLDMDTAAREGGLARNASSQLEGGAADTEPRAGRTGLDSVGSPLTRGAGDGDRPSRVASDRKPSAPAVIRTTLDAAMQVRARDALREQLAELRGRNVEDGAVVVLDNASGDVIAWVGSSGSLSEAPAVDAVLARRQPGSTLKPFLYEQAIEARWLTAASILEDTPARLRTSSGLYIPQDYDHDFKGSVS